MTSRPNDRRDAGMTLIELVVTITVIGAIATVLATAVTVTFRQQNDTAGNLDVARWEQALALWMPSDLASADPNSLDDDPTLAAPSGCIEAVCSEGSNVLSLRFDDGSGETVVAYRYLPDDQGEGYRMVRIECVAGSCTTRTVLRDLAAPADPGWTAGDPIPSSVMNVSVPDVVVDDTNQAHGSSDTDARSITIAVNAVDDSGGTNRSSIVTITAGGVTRGELELPTFEGPSFIEARSGCGGPVTLLIDRSGSIQDLNAVASGIESFVRAFEGTPTQLQVVIFGDRTHVIGSTGDDPFYYDLAEPADVTTLVGDPAILDDGDIGPYTYGWDTWGVGSGTNWWDALTRAYVDRASGEAFATLGDPTRPAPELVVLFTDGMPSWGSTYTPPPVVPPEYDDSGRSPDFHYWFEDADPSAPYGWAFRSRYWYEANSVAEQYRDSARLVGVGIGSAFTGYIRVHPELLPEWTTEFVPVPSLLGDLVAGLSTPPAYDGTDHFEMATHDPATGWGDVSTANVLTSGDLTKLGSGLAAIALSECGGTLTVQTRDAATATPADESVTYTVGSEQATTSRLLKAVTFDVPFNGQASATPHLVPQLPATGLTADGWTCKSGGTDLVQGSDWHYLTAGDPGGGIRVTVTPNSAVSCTLEVT